MTSTAKCPNGHPLDSPGRRSCPVCNAATEFMVPDETGGRPAEPDATLADADRSLPAPAPQPAPEHDTSEWADHPDDADGTLDVPPEPARPRQGDATTEFIPPESARKELEARATPPPAGPDTLADTGERPAPSASVPASAAGDATLSPELAAPAAANRTIVESAETPADRGATLPPDSLLSGEAGSHSGSLELSDSVQATMAVSARLTHTPKRAAGGDSTVHTMSGGGVLEEARPGAMPWPEILDFEILEELGRGGMGVVYKARQLSLNRVVALKMVLAGAHLKPNQLARFHEEADILAQLQHPNIVQIYEVGQHEGLPYFALEYVDGGSLQQKLAATTIAPRPAAGLVETLARAIHAAHQRGIIHRDIKPGNILLTRNAEVGSRNSASRFSHSEFEPKVTDFGLAKRLEGDSAHTRTGTIMGTPSYMAPEQAEGRHKEVGTLADVYSLGAILYELLTGKPPFKAATPMDTILQVIKAEPVPPSRIQPKLPRDLETICLKCLQKEPAKRYATALDLAEDLRRFLNNEPIRARRVGPLGHALKWARRRPAAAALVAVLATVLLTIVGGGWWYADRERQRRIQADELRAHAEKNYLRARRAVEQISSLGKDRLANVPRMEKLRRDVLDQALQFYQDFLTEKSTDPGLQRETAWAYERVGDIQTMLGDQQAAEQAYRSALELFDRLADQYGKQADYQRDLAACCNNLGNLLRDTNAAEAKKCYERALDLRRDLAGRFPAQPEYAQDQAVSSNNLGILLQAAGELQAAEGRYRDALTLKEKLVNDFPAEARYRADLATTCDNLGNLLQTRNEHREADDLYRRGEAVLEKLAADFPRDPEYRRRLARIQTNRGVLLETTRRHAEAREAYRKAIGLLTALVADFEDVPDYRQELARAHVNEGTLLDMGHEPKAAEDSYRQAVKIFSWLTETYRAIPDYRHELGNTCTNLSHVLAAAGRPQEARQAQDRGADLLGRLVAEYPKVPVYRQDLARARHEQGILLAAADRPDEAEKAFREALALQQELAAKYPDNPAYRQELARTYDDLGILLARGQRLPRAEEAFRHAAELQEQLLKGAADNPAYVRELIPTWTNLANLQVSTDRFRDAAKSFQRVAELQEKLAAAFPKEPAYQSDLGRALHDLGGVLLSRNQLADAADAAEQAVRRQQAALDLRPERAYRELLGSHYRLLGEIRVRQGRYRDAVGAAGRMIDDRSTGDDYVEAAGLYARCVPLAEKDPNAGTQERQKLAHAYADEALRLLERAVEHGYRDGNKLDQDADFAPLRGRDEFRKLLAGLTRDKKSK